MGRSGFCELDVDCCGVRVENWVMQVHLKQIPQGGTLHLEGEEDSDFVGIEEAGAVALSPVSYVLDVGLSEGGLFATGQITMKVGLTCVACLETYEKILRVESFGVQKELDGRELVDLTEEIREDIHLALPAYPRCDADGKKTCPARFAQTPEGADSDQSGSVAWQALDKLKKTD